MISNSYSNDWICPSSCSNRSRNAVLSKSPGPSRYWQGTSAWMHWSHDGLVLEHRDRCLRHLIKPIILSQSTPSLCLLQSIPLTGKCLTNASFDRPLRLSPRLVASCRQRAGHLHDTKKEKEKDQMKLISVKTSNKKLFREFEMYKLQEKRDSMPWYKWRVTI